MEIKTFIKEKDRLYFAATYENLSQDVLEY